jgi:hypothetical protein
MNYIHISYYRKDFTIILHIIIVQNEINQVFNELHFFFILCDVIVYLCNYNAYKNVLKKENTFPN